MKQNLKQEYHELSTKIGNIIDITINSYLDSFAYKKFPEKAVMYEKMLKFKQGTQKLRGTAAYLALCAFKSEGLLEEDKVKRILAAVELENYSNYALNWGFDGKAGVRDKKSREESILAAFGFLNDALDITEDMPEISKHIRKYNHRVHRGWTPEVYDLKFENKELFRDFNKFWKAYEIRNVEAGGQFYGSYIYLAHLFTDKKNKALIEALTDIYITFGEYVQIINDIGDFAVIDKKWVSEKKVVDQFSDLRNNVITWPTWLMCTKGTDEDKTFLESIVGQNELEEKTIQRISELFYEHAYEEIIAKLKKKRRFLQKQLKRVDIDPKVRGLMQVMISMVSSNKIFRELKIQKKNFHKEFVVLVDSEDKVIGKKEKLQVHIDGDLHRAFSVLVFNAKGELLIQRRADSKYHCPGQWANTTCSHPRGGERVQKAAHRRLIEEMGFDCQLERGFKFQYRVEFDNGLIENEIDRVFFGKYNGNVSPNSEEVSEYKWIPMDELRFDIREHPEKYTAWFKIILERMEKEVRKNEKNVRKN